MPREWDTDELEQGYRVAWWAAFERVATAEMLVDAWRHGRNLRLGGTQWQTP